MSEKEEINFEIPRNGFIGWECSVCGKCITSDPEGLPSSKYWNVERKEVYCSTEHSLQRHEERSNEEDILVKIPALQQGA